MNNEKIVQKISKEIEKRVSSVSNLQRDIYGMKSDLLDVFLLEGKSGDHRIYGEKIKSILEKKITKAKTRQPIRKKYIENMERIIHDLEKRIEGKKTDNTRKNILNLNKRSFTREVMKEIADEMIQEAMTNGKIHTSNIYKNLKKNKSIATDMERFLKHRSTEIEDKKQQMNVNILIENMQEKEKTIHHRSPKTKQLIMAFGILLGIGLTTRGGRELRQNLKKQDIEKIANTQNNKKNVTREEQRNREILQTNINDTLLAEGIHYEEVIDAIKNLSNQKTKNEIITYINTEDIIGLQTYLGMKEDSPYALNKATGIIDQHTMDILKGGWFGATGKEILENDTISQDVKDAYKEFMEGRINNNNQNYLIQSKICMHSFLFDTEHRLIDLQPIIVGRDIGKDQEYVPFARFYENGVRKYYKDIDPKELNRNTPEGLYAIEGIDQIEEEDYLIDGPKEAIILDPIILTTPELTYDKTKIKMRDHPLFIAEGMQYVQALETPETTDNNQSKGCINHKNFGRVKENLKTDPNGSRVYITQYTKYKNMEQKKDKICINDKKNYFPSIRRK